MYWQDTLGKALIITGIVFLVGVYNTSWLYLAIPAVGFIVAIAFAIWGWNSNDILLRATGLVVGIVIFIFVMFMFSGSGLIINALMVGGLFEEIEKFAVLVNSNRLIFGIAGIILIILGFAMRRFRVRYFHRKPHYFFK